LEKLGVSDLSSPAEIVGLEVPIKDLGVVVTVKPISAPTEDDFQDRGRRLEMVSLPVVGEGGATKDREFLADDFRCVAEEVCDGGQVLGVDGPAVVCAEVDVAQACDQQAKVDDAQMGACTMVSSFSSSLFAMIEHPSSLCGVICGSGSGGVLTKVADGESGELLPGGDEDEGAGLLVPHDSVSCAYSNLNVVADGVVPMNPLIGVVIASRAGEGVLVREEGRAPPAAKEALKSQPTDKLRQLPWPPEESLPVSVVEAATGGGLLGVVQSSRSYAYVVHPDRRADVELSYVPPIDGGNSITMKESDEDAERWGYCLVGYFL
ncbi:hypothetical protein Dimus_015957, partial [Dionaea muscipula]